MRVCERSAWCHLRRERGARRGARRLARTCRICAATKNLQASYLQERPVRARPRVKEEVIRRLRGPRRTGRALSGHESLRAEKMCVYHSRNAREKRCVGLLVPLGRAYAVRSEAVQFETLCRAYVSSECSECQSAMRNDAETATGKKNGCRVDRFLFSNLSSAPLHMLSRLPPPRRPRGANVKQKLDHSSYTGGPANSGAVYVASSSSPTATSESSFQASCAPPRPWRCTNHLTFGAWRDPA